MVEFQKRPLTAQEIKAQAKKLGADLVGIADGAVMNAHPPDPEHPQRPSDLSDYDADTVIVLAKRLSLGTSRLTRWDERHKYYNDELALTALEETGLELVLWLEDQGYPALVVPPTHVDPWRYRGDPSVHLAPVLLLSHAAVEAGLGTLGLNEQLLTPEYGPRIIVSAVLVSVKCEYDEKKDEPLCLGPECGRCLQSCPGDVIGHWQRDWPACDRYRSPHGFRQFVDHVSAIVDAPSAEEKKALLNSREQFNLWQSILRGSGVVTGCRRCQDVCPVGDDYALLADALETIPEATAEKQARLDQMLKDEQSGNFPESYRKAARWIGRLPEKPTNGDG